MITERESEREEKINLISKDLYRSILRENRPVYLDVWGMSMFPFIKNGDRVKISPLGERDIKIGDIIAVDIKNETRFFVHRVVKIEGKNGNRIYFTKGDFSGKGLDRPVATELIAGKVSEVYRSNLEINLEHPAWERLNRFIAKMSYGHPLFLYFISRCLNAAIEWRSFPFKVKNRLKKGNPVLYNAEELLLLSSRRDFDENTKQKTARLIKEGINWKHFTELAMRGGVTATVYDTLLKIASSVRIPQRVLNRVESGYFFIVAKVASQHREFLRLLKLFEENNIAVLPLKGTFLSNRLYSDTAARGLSVDFDLLIKEKDKEEARILLEEYGYALTTVNEIDKWQWQYLFFKPKSKMIDLHWDITMMLRSAERIEGLWKGARRVAEEKIGYYEFKEEELLLYLAAHLTNSSRFGQVRYACDINEFLRKYGGSINWTSIIEKSRRWKMSGSLYAAVRLADSLFGSDLPVEVLKKIKPSLLKRLFIDAFVNRAVIFRQNFRKRLMEKFLSYVFFELVEASSAREYLGVLNRIIFPPRETLNVKNDDAKPILVTYMTRIFKGIFKILKTRPSYK